MTQHATPDPSADDIAKDVAAAIVAHRLPPGTRLREEALAGPTRSAAPRSAPRC